jgi:ADP-heptose:LPS heptosyltransferase
MGRVLLAPVSYGLGDLVVSLPAITALVAEGAPVWLVARAPSQVLLADRIRGLAGVVPEEGLTPGPHDRLVDLRDHPLQRASWWGSPGFEAAFGPLGINDLLGRICADFGIEADFSRPEPLLAHPRAGLGGTVLLVQDTDGSAKRWPAGAWAAVASGLRAGGHDVARVAKEEEGPSPADGCGVPALVLATPGDVVDAMTACRGVIGVDTGLTHIAAQQGVPTVTVCRHSSVYFRPWPHCRAVRGGRCTDECTATEAAYAYHQEVSLEHVSRSSWACPSGSPCMEGAAPEDAVALLRELL